MGELLLYFSEVLGFGCGVLIVVVGLVIGVDVLEMKWFSWVLVVVGGLVGCFLGCDIGGGWWCFVWDCWVVVCCYGGGFLVFGMWFGLVVVWCVFLWLIKLFVFGLLFLLSVFGLFGVVILIFNICIWLLSLVVWFFFRLLCDLYCCWVSLINCLFGLCCWCLWYYCCYFFWCCVWWLIVCCFCLDLLIEYFWFVVLFCEFGVLWCGLCYCWKWWYIVCCCCW